MIHKSFLLCVVSATFFLFLLSVPVSATGLFKTATSYDTGSYDTVSVAVADFNGDGKSDVAVVNDQAGVAVLLGNGDGTFKPEVAYGSGGYDPRQVTVADVNGDGIPDLLVANYCSPTYPFCSNTAGSVGVLLGKGDGTFKSPRSYNSGGVNAIWLAVGDVNRDGKLDVLVGNACSNKLCQDGPSITVMLGDGKGGFVRGNHYKPGGYNLSSLVLADVNGDGKLDLLTANQCTGPSNLGGCASGSVVGVLLGNGDGTFQSAVTYSAGGWDSGSILTADINGDGKLDLLVANGCTSGSINGCGSNLRGLVGVLLGNGDGTFQAARTFDTGGEYARAVLATDVNGDGKLDLLVANQCAAGYFSTCAKGGVGVLLGNDDGTFQAATSYLSGGWEATSIAIADVNGDHKPDVLTSNTRDYNRDFSGSVGVLIHK
jgi:FG-GAP-like repeat